MFKLSMKVLLKIRLPEATVANAVKVVEAEATRMATMATGAVAPTQLPDAIIKEEIDKRITIFQIAHGIDEANLALTDLVNFLHLNAVPFLAKETSSGMRTKMIKNCHEYLKYPKSSVELKEACTALLTVIEPSSKSATRKNKSPSPAKAANSPKPVHASKSSNSTKKAEPSKHNNSSKYSTSAKSAVQAVQQLAAAAEAVEEMAAPAAAGAAKKLTRKEKNKLYWKKRRELQKRTKTRKEAGASK
jgi:hypothetical protein